VASRVLRRGRLLDIATLTLVKITPYVTRTAVGVGIVRIIPTSGSAVVAVPTTRISKGDWRDASKVMTINQT
jgi:hypothetical protein